MIGGAHLIERGVSPADLAAFGALDAGARGGRIVRQAGCAEAETLALACLGREGKNLTASTRKRGRTSVGLAPSLTLRVGTADVRACTTTRPGARRAPAGCIAGRLN